MSNSTRDYKIMLDALCTPMTYEEIGNKHGVSATRVRYVFGREIQNLNRVCMLKYLRNTDAM
jgi:hypothetical protein